MRALRRASREQGIVICSTVLLALENDRDGSRRLVTNPQDGGAGMQTGETVKIMSIVGARPNFMKVAPIIAAIRAHNARSVPPGELKGRTGNLELIEHVLVHTGQHYDQDMSASFFVDLGLPEPDYNLRVGSGSHAAQTADIMKAFEQVLRREQPDVLIVVGDVNSTLACALVAAKTSFGESGGRPLIAHVEAGLRSFDRTMPEEVNRVLTDQLSDLLFTTEESARHNLAREGVLTEKIHFVGNTMIDSLLAYKEKAATSSVVEDLGLRTSVAGSGNARLIARYALLTLHRAANVDDQRAFVSILEGLQDLASQCLVIFPAHPRTQKRIIEFGLECRFEWSYMRDQLRGTRAAVGSRPIRIVDPLRYVDFLSLMTNAALVITDSGGIQEETTCLGVPCVTVRSSTERPVTVTVGTNVIGGREKQSIREAIRRQLESKRRAAVPARWDGESARRILQAITLELAHRRLSVPKLSVHG
jgi:UDP-N-acetylglucosamine 2-epimerase (non-hydrolysing)